MTTTQKIVLGAALLGGGVLAYKYLKNQSPTAPEAGPAASVAADSSLRTGSGDLNVRQPGGGGMIVSTTGEKVAVNADSNYVQMGPLKVANSLSIG